MVQNISWVLCIICIVLIESNVENLHKSSVNWPCCHFTATHSPWRHLTAICPQFFSQIRPESHKAAVVNFPRKFSQGGWKRPHKIISWLHFKSNPQFRMNRFFEYPSRSSGRFFGIVTASETGWRDFKAGRMRWHIGGRALEGQILSVFLSSSSLTLSYPSSLSSVPK